MVLTWHGATCVHLQTSAASLLLDPADRRLKADGVLYTDGKNPNIAKFQGGGAFLITTPGEYELRGLAIRAVEMNGVTVFTIAADGCVVGHLGSINRPPTDAELESLIDIDILFLAVGNGALTPKQATEVVSAIEPRVILPLGESLEAFRREMGVRNAAPQPKLRITKKDLPTDDVRIIFLTKA